MRVPNPIALGEQLVDQTLTDAVRQTTRAASLPIGRAIVLNLANALEGGVPRQRNAVSAAGLPTIGTFAGGGLLSTVPNLVVDAVGTTMRLVPAMIGAGLGVVTSTVNAFALTGLASVRAVLNVGAAALTLNPVAVLDAAALGAVRVASVVEQTTIGTPSLAYVGPPGSPQPYATVARRIPSIVTSILNGRQEIANAIFPSAVRAQAATAQISTASAATAAVTASDTSTPVAKATALTTQKKVSSKPKHAKR